MKSKRLMCWPASWYLAAAALIFGLMGVGAASARAATSPTLEEVKSRGHLVCGVVEGAAGFATVDKQGTWAGLDIDFCRAVAAAVLGRKDAVKFKSLTAANRFQALSGREVDLLARVTSWSLTRDTELGVDYAGTLFLDGQGFLVRRGFAVASVLELSGASVCAMGGTSAERAVADYFRSRQMRYQLVVSERWPDVVKAYADGGCTLLTGDISVLALERSRLTSPIDHMILPELISKEPSGPVVRRGDEQWLTIVRWTMNALVAAEELGITSENADTLRETSVNVDTRRFLGAEGNLGEAMGLERNWSYRVVSQQGSYGELFERNLGAKSPLALERGVNNLWTRGGVLYAVPLR